ncbi:hypothetical protein FIBSPDRAFT_858044 [Athelia psychrophila]|uniref:Uncharacterized protein n=1 Tax=Athelia psychrophila TaxID=1759441 RepID=A0A166L356_9AGAM|nr:hypothetical protein FIBSPDRAFT_859311 [Fibularhizoctonia sp. CBS 109695]KZP23882.1 hypothetical protein FIBSPDRAFT_858044 [Fibularhizoctonia sp. CBS 109695]
MHASHPHIPLHSTTPHHPQPSTTLHRPNLYLYLYLYIISAPSLSFFSLLTRILCVYMFQFAFVYHISTLLFPFCASPGSPSIPPDLPPPLNDLHVHSLANSISLSVTHAPHTFIHVSCYLGSEHC